MAASALHNLHPPPSGAFFMRDEEGEGARMNVMKNWGCLNKIKLVGILLAGGPLLYLPPCFATTSPFFRLLFAKLASARSAAFRPAIFLLAPFLAQRTSSSTKRKRVCLVNRIDAVCVVRHALQEQTC